MQHQFPPGCRFYPTDQELITYFLDMKIKGQPIIYKNLVRDFDIYTKDPWVIWNKFGGDYLEDKIDQDLGLFFITELKKHGSKFARSVPSGRWHGDAAGDLVTESTGSPIGIKKYFIYKSKKPTTDGHHGKWKMHEITSLLDPSSNYVLCQLQKNGKGKRKMFGLETETRAAVSCDDGVHEQKRQKLSSHTNQQGEAEQSGFCEAEDNHVCASAKTDFEYPFGNSTAITDLTDKRVSLDELMNILYEETDTCALSDTHLNMRTEIVETEGHTSRASLGVDMGSIHADAVVMGMGVTNAYSSACSSDSNGDFTTDLVHLFTDDPQFASLFLLPEGDSMLPGWSYNASCADS